MRATFDEDQEKWLQEHRAELTFLRGGGFKVRWFDVEGAAHHLVDVRAETPHDLLEAAMQHSSREGLDVDHD